MMYLESIQAEREALSSLMPRGPSWTPWAVSFGSAKRLTLVARVARWK